MRRRMMVLVGVSAVVGLIGGVIGGVALATPVMNASAETAMGPLVDRPLAANMDFENGSKGEVELQTKGDVKVAFQKITIGPGGTLGWHSHPGPTVVTVAAGTLSFYHAEDCTQEIEFATGQSFSNLPDEIHLARNEGTGNVVLFAVYFVPQSIATPPELRINQPSPGASCPQ
jgi:quercetin dioxygenase-like cupin family protein